jgi:aldose 1-epimerase
LGNDNTLAIDVKATADQATPCNIVHHSYWNLGGHDSGSSLQEILEVDAQRYTPTDSTLIPTGELQSVEGTPFDFRTPKAIGRDIGELPPMGDSPGGYDMNFVVDGVPDRMRRVTRSTNADTGIVMTISADQPGVQFYTGNWLDGIEGKDGAKYDQNGGYCLETQFFPDSVNHQGEAGWPDAVLRPGETYSHSMVHAFTVQ